ncbi:aspartate/glutamate racemase family protein [Variovorax sp. J22R133]|uniref:aspartate/glutamate racemase family protein n=1 Tax=Variovorax brevis TaxID=3053503 RepID=UPI0025770659|nr:aspartate/glutamate racemase family protein [Variovorax sp. J22R133]MDM0111721.1 aspartate/glutamate racemase family protein [Variovorax sp. J22R133]
MPRLLVINPNTSALVSAMLQHHVKAAVGHGLDVTTITARFGAPYISNESSYAVAGHAVLDAWAVACAKELAPDAVLLGCFGDPGLFALQEGAGVPVGGLAQAAFLEAATHGRFAIVTGGERWKPMLERLASSLGYADQLAGIHTVRQTGAELAADPARAHVLLADACTKAAERFGVQAVILGGAGLAGMAVDIAPQLPFALIDSVEAGARWAREAIAAPTRHTAAAVTPGRFGVDWQNVSWELSALR